MILLLLGLRLAGASPTDALQVQGVAHAAQGCHDLSPGEPLAPDARVTFTAVGPMGGWIYAAAQTSAGRCVLLYPRDVLERGYAGPTRGPVRIPSYDTYGAPTSPGESLTFLSLAFPLASADESLICELVRTGESFEAYLAPYRGADAAPTWGQLLARRSLDLDWQTEIRVDDPAAGGPHSAGYASPARGVVELARTSLTYGLAVDPSTPAALSWRPCGSDTPVQPAR